jgi:hypothetical protein
MRPSAFLSRSDRKKFRAAETFRRPETLLSDEDPANYCEQKMKPHFRTLRTAYFEARISLLNRRSARRIRFILSSFS